MVKTGATITVAPQVNEEAVQAYAEHHQTREPFVHTAGRLEALASVSTVLDNYEDDLESIADDEARRVTEDMLRRIKQLHRDASNDLLGMFVSRRA